MVIESGKEHSLLSQFLSELRDIEMQKYRMRFRENLERTGKIFAYEISKQLKRIDEELTSQGYIVPRLSDAGDLAFGEKT